MKVNKTLDRVASMLVVLTLSVAITPLAAVAQTAATGAPSLPDVFPGYSFLQGNLDGPFGRAIALYVNGAGHEDWSFLQVIVAGADSDSYRRLDIPSSPSGDYMATVLAPDGTKVFAGSPGGPDGEFTVIDLATGTTGTYPVSTESPASPRAVSADGRYVAYLAKTKFSRAGTLYVLDLTTGSSKEIAAGVSSAAFSPDGTQLAFQVSGPPPQAIHIVSLDGTPVRDLGVLEGVELAGPQAWSPDGKYIAAIATGPQRMEGQGYVTDESLIFLDATSSGQAVPNAVAGIGQEAPGGGQRILGWRSASSVLVSTSDTNESSANVITEINILTGTRQAISRFTAGASDDLAVTHVQLATGLLPGLKVRAAGEPDRGAWPLWAIVTTSVLAGLFAVIVALSWLLRRRRAVVPSRDGI